MSERVFYPGGECPGSDNNHCAKQPAVQTHGSGQMRQQADKDEAEQPAGKPQNTDETPCPAQATPQRCVLCKGKTVFDNVLPKYGG